MTDAASNSQSQSDATASNTVSDDIDTTDGFLDCFRGRIICPTPVAAPAAAYTAVDDSDSWAVPNYNMNHKKRGKCLIFNQVDFSVKGLGKRDGSNRDAAALKERFEQLGFEVDRHDNLRKSEIEDKLRTAAKKATVDEDCFVCCFMSHGEEGDYVFASDRKLHVSELLEPFKGDKCMPLAGKPKLFFIQACRGDKLDSGTQQADGPTQQPVRIPSEADFLIAYSGPPGYVSWRRPTEGSWFMQALCEVLEKCSETLDLLTMMTLVNARVARQESRTDRTKTSGKKQVCYLVSMLTKQVWLR